MDKSDISIIRIRQAIRAVEAKIVDTRRLKRRSRERVGETQKAIEKTGYTETSRGMLQSAQDALHVLDVTETAQCRQRDTLTLMLRDAERLARGLEVKCSDKIHAAFRDDEDLRAQWTRQAGMAPRDGIAHELRTCKRCSRTIYVPRPDVPLAPDLQKPTEGA